jgi:hypothetical protein
MQNPVPSHIKIRGEPIEIADLFRHRGGGYDGSVSTRSCMFLVRLGVFAVSR